MYTMYTSFGCLIQCDLGLLGSPREPVGAAAGVEHTPPNTARAQKGGSVVTLGWSSCHIRPFRPFDRFGIARLLSFFKYEHPFSHVCQCIVSTIKVSCFEGRTTASSRAKNLIGRFPEI